MENYSNGFSGTKQSPSEFEVGHFDTLVSLPFLERFYNASINLNKVSHHIYLSKWRLVANVSRDENKEYGSLFTTGILFNNDNFSCVCISGISCFVLRGFSSCLEKKHYKLVPEVPHFYDAEQKTEKGNNWLPKYEIY